MIGSPKSTSQGNIGVRSRGPDGRAGRTRRGRTGYRETEILLAVPALLVGIVTLCWAHRRDRNPGVPSSAGQARLITGAILCGLGFVDPLAPWPRDGVVHLNSIPHAVWLFVPGALLMAWGLWASRYAAPTPTRMAAPPRPGSEHVPEEER